jgi:thymidylate synthase
VLQIGSTNIIGASVDELVIKGIRNIKENSEVVEGLRAGDAKQAYNVNYILTNSLDRIHNLRLKQGLPYLCKEVLMYFKGTLEASDMANCSSFWNKLADKNGKINSNYGYYVFHQELENGDKQYDWAIKLLSKKLETRRVLININQPYHKDIEHKDFPCTISIQYFVSNGYLCSVISSRSTDIITGLPYDMGFFSLLTELVCKDLQERGHTDLLLGYTMMKSTFTQFYYSKAHVADEIDSRSLHNKQNPLGKKVIMPCITSAKDVLQDIKNGTTNSQLCSWLVQNSNLL